MGRSKNNEATEKYWIFFIICVMMTYTYNHTQTFNLALLYDSIVVIWDRFHMTYHISPYAQFRVALKL